MWDIAYGIEAKFSDRNASRDYTPVIILRSTSLKSDSFNSGMESLLAACLCRLICGGIEVKRHTLRGIPENVHANIRAAKDKTTVRVRKVAQKPLVVDGGLNPRISGGALKVGTNFAVDLLAARWRVDRRLSTP